MLQLMLSIEEGPIWFNFDSDTPSHKDEVVEDHPRHNLPFKVSNLEDNPYLFIY